MKCEQLELFPLDEVSLRCHNADCFDVLPKIPSESVDLVITDPPYGVNFKNDFYNDNNDDVIMQMPTLFSELKRVMKPNSYLFIFLGVKNLHLWTKCALDSGLTFKNIVATRAFTNKAIPTKNNFVFQFQPVLVLSKGGGRKFNDVDFVPTSEQWFKDKRNKNPQEFTYSYPNWIKSEWAYATPTGKRNNTTGHPNEKNVDLLQFFVKIASDEGDVVLDPFMGSGSCGVACRELKRQFVGIEKDKHWFDVANGRLKNDTRR